MIYTRALLVLESLLLLATFKVLAVPSTQLLFSSISSWVLLVTFWSLF